MKGFWTYENRLVVILTAAGGVAGFDTLALNYLVPFIAIDLGLSNMQIGLFGLASLVSWSLSGVALAFLSDRIGRRRPFLVGVFVLFALFSTGSALSVSFLTLLLSRVMIGLTEGPVIPVMQSMIAAESSVHRRGLNMGIVQNFGSQLIGALVSPLLLVWIATRFDWRAAFFIAGVPGLIIAGLIMRFVREPRTVVALDSLGETTSAVSASFREIFGHRNILLCLTIGSFSIAWFFLMLTFLPLWAIRTVGLSPSAMSVAISGVGAAGALSAVLVPFLSDRIGRRPAMIAFSLIGAAAPIILLLFTGGLGMISLVVFLGSFILGTFPLFISIVPIESVAPHHAAMATAVVMGGGQILGGIVGPLVGGVLADRFSLAAPLWLAAGLALMAALTSVLIVETAPVKAIPHP